jgi:CHAT domain-containing protein
MLRALFACLTITLALCWLSFATSQQFVRAQSASTAQDAVTQLAAAIAQATDETTRKALLDAQPALATPALVKALMDASDPFADKGQYQAAIALRNFALALAERIGDREGATRLLRRIGGAYYRLNQYDKAWEYGERTLKLATELQHPEIIGYAHVLFANIHNSREEFALAETALRKALAYFEQSNLLEPQGSTWNDIANNYRGWGKFEQAEAAYERALALHQQTNNQRSRAITLLNQANLFFSRSDYLRARTQYQRAYELLMELKLTHFAPIALGNIGVVERLLGNMEQAEAALQRALKLLAEIGDEAGQFSALSGLGNLYFERGDYLRAQEQYQRLRSLAEKLGNKLNIGVALMNTAGVYERNNQLALALATNRQALPLFEQLGDKKQLATLWQKFGDLYDASGQPTEARAAWEKALQYAGALEDRSEQSSIYESLVGFYRRRQEFSTAEEALQRATQLAQAASLRVRLLSLHEERAALQLARGEYTAAIQTVEQLQREAAALGYNEAFLEACVTAGRAHLALKQPAQAERAFTQAINLIETLRTQTAAAETNRQSFLSTRLVAHQALLPVLIQQQRYTEALALAERMKARALLDALQTQAAPLVKTLTQTEQQHERELVETLANLNAQLRAELTAEKPDRQRAAGLTARRDQARLAREAFEVQLYATHPELRAQRGASRLINLNEANILLPDAQTACLEFAVTDEQAFLFVLTRAAQASGEAVLNVYPLSLTHDSLSRRTTEFRRLLAARDPAYKPAARALFNTLLAPARAQLQGKTRLLIVPDAALWELPFQALLDENNRHLLESCAIAYAPSLTVLREMSVRRQRMAATSGLLALGNPQFNAAQIERRQLALRAETLAPLPAAEREVKALAPLYNPMHSRIYTGTTASETRFKAEANQARVLHIATHGVLNDAAPLYSHLVLATDESSDDGLLEAWELLRLDLRAELAVLSACETARGRIGAGEGLIGLTWALFVAGCPTTVASQWKVESASTTQLMIEFHRRLNEARPTSKAEALRAAALKLLASDAYRHPFYWAGFVVMGDGRY